jgi:hypothetical protein
MKKLYTAQCTVIQHTDISFHAETKEKALELVRTGEFHEKTCFQEYLEQDNDHRNTTPYALIDEEGNVIAEKDGEKIILIEDHTMFRDQTDVE